MTEMMTRAQAAALDRATDDTGDLLAEAQQLAGSLYLALARADQGRGDLDTAVAAFDAGELVELLARTRRRESAPTAAPATTDAAKRLILTAC